MRFSPRRVICATLIYMCAALMAAPAVQAESEKAKIYAPAPAFTLKDEDGKDRTLAEFKGKVVVLEWTNALCPYVQKHYKTGNMQALQKDAHNMGAVWLTINSSAPGLQGHMTAEDVKKGKGQSDSAETAYLFDPDGTVGKLYGAKTTPHMFIVAPNGILVYDGAIDDMPSSDIETLPRATNYVRAALSDLSDGRPVTTTLTRPYGCGVKYKN